MCLVLDAHPLTGSPAFPRKFTAKERGEVQKLPYIGAKISKMVGCARLNIYSYTHIRQIDEYLFHGHIPEVGTCSITHPRHVIQAERVTEKMRESERFKTLSLFTTVYGIGPTTARTLYDRGLRSFRDLEAYYEVDIGVENSESADMNIRIALKLRDELVLTCGPPARTRAQTFVLTLAQHTARRS